LSTQERRDEIAAEIRAAQEKIAAYIEGRPVSVSEPMWTWHTPSGVRLVSAKAKPSRPWWMFWKPRTWAATYTFAATTPTFTQADLNALYALLQKARNAGFWPWLIGEIQKIAGSFGPIVTPQLPQPAPGPPPPIPPPIAPLMSRREMGEAAD
jgi:hypothetical protein